MKRLPLGGLLVLAVLAVSCASRGPAVYAPLPRRPAPQDPSIPLQDQNENLRESLRELSDENRRLQEKIQRLEKAAGADARVLLERNESLERLLAERERVVEAKASEAYARGRLEMAGEIVQKLEVRGVPTRQERWIGADHYFSFEVWYGDRRVVHMPVETKSAESPTKVLLSSAVSAASLLGGL